MSDTDTPSVRHRTVRDTRRDCLRLLQRMQSTCSQFHSRWMIGFYLLLGADGIFGSGYHNSSVTPGQCELYSGSVCNDYLGNNSRVFVSGSKSMLQVDNELSAAFAEVLDQQDILDNCADNAKALLCHWVYPTCGENNRTLPLCNDNICEEIRTVSCFRDWSTLETKIEALGYLNVSRFSCDAERVSDGPCTKVGFHDSCFVDNGSSYRGNVNITAEGHHCQDWAKQRPHQHQDTPDKYPSLAGHNYCRNPNHTRAVPVCHPRTITVHTDWEEPCAVPRCKNDQLYSPGQCFPVNETWYCSRFLDSKRHVFAESLKVLGDLDDDFVLLSTSLTNPTLTARETCIEQIGCLICHHFFPYCSTSPGFPVPIPVCQRDCHIVETKTCQAEYNLFRLWVDEFDFKRLHFLNCSKLPELKTDLRHGDQGCFRLGCTKNASTTSRDDCADPLNRGINYVGTVNISLKRAPCLFWSDTYPRSHSFNPDMFLELRGNNYCRNPGGHDRFGPYCYISQDGLPVRDRCNIPECRDTGKNSGSSNGDGKADFPVAIILGSTIPCGILIMFLVILISIFLYQRRHKDKEMASTFPSAFIQSELNTNTEASPTQGSLELEKLGLPEHLYFPKDNLTFIENLGEGNFGKVFKAEAVNIAGIEGTTTVAVKTLKETVYEQTYVDFAKEAQVMVQLDHPNIVRLLGVSVSSGQPCLIFEFMSKGDLNHFLQSASPDMQHEEQKCKLKVSDLIAMAVYIASGMEYLARNRYVHRDLATRNCLVNEDNTVKLADFGLTRDVYDSDYYRVRGGAALPIRWMPPESIVYGRFTYTSDIWSFGIVLWEIFTFGKKPFYGMTNEAVIDFVVNRKGVPSPPSSCPFAVGNLILQCCQIDPKKRPPFTEILAVLLQAQLYLLHTSYKD